MSVIIKSTSHGRRAFPIDTNHAEHLVAQGRAQRIKAFFYRELTAQESAVYEMPADLEITETDDEETEKTETPRRGRPRKS